MPSSIDNPKYTIGQLVLYDSGHEGERAFGTVIGYKMRKAYSDDPEEELHYIICWADGFNDGEGNLFKEDTMDDYAVLLEEALNK